MRRFFIPDQNIHDTTTIVGQNARHLKDVLRLDVGDTVCLIDGGGREHRAEITHIEPGAVTLAILETRAGTAESPVHITLAQSYLKDKKMDTLVRQITELGISRFLPVQASRSVPRPDANKLRGRLDRWGKIAQESLKQCGRSVLPEIGEPVDFQGMLHQAQDYDLKILFWEKSRGPIPSDADLKKKVRRIILLLGPEGGFSDDEAAQAEEKGFIAASLGPRILKAETATLAACSLAQHLFGDMA